MAMSLSSIPMSAGGRKSTSQSQTAIDARMNVAASRSAASSIYKSVDTSAFARPVGIVNEGNTCFFGSVIQSLAATGSLIELLGPVIFPQDKAEEIEEVSKQVNEEEETGDAAAGISKEEGLNGKSSEKHDPFLQPNQAITGAVKPNTLLGLAPPSLARTPSHLNIPHPTPTIPPAQLIPSLRDEALEINNARLLPVTLAFERALGRAWKAKDSGIKAATEASAPTKTEHGDGQTAVKAESSKTNGKSKAASEQADKKEEAKSLSFRALLKEVARKYDQYADYRQQDAHELLRHLLDSMSMEEQDLIKVLQPPPPPQPAVPFVPGERRRKRRKTLVNPIPEEEKMVPFADALFGGSLVSMVICEGCKNVSHTYEGFLDMSLSLKSSSVPRKRDKFKGLADRFRRGSSKEAEGSVAQPKSFFLEGVHSDADAHGETTEADTETESLRAGNHEKPTTGSDGGKPEVTHAPQETSKAQKRSSFSSWTGRKTSKSMSDLAAVREEAASGLRSDINSPKANISSSGSSNNLHRPNSAASDRSDGKDNHTIPPKPTPEQAAYIRRILNGPTLPDPADDPLERLRAGIANMAAGVPTGSSGKSHVDDGLLNSTIAVEGFGTDLMECLRNFTSVEILEGDNAFACHKCWKYKAGRIRRPPRAAMMPSSVMEEDEDADDDEEELEPARGGAVSTISRGDSFALTETSSIAASCHGGSEAIVKLPTIAITDANDAESQPSRNDADSGFAESRVGSLRAASALTPSHRSGSDASEGGSSGYATTDGETSDEAPNPSAFIRPPMAPRRQSTRFVLQRAFKRYWIARPPPVMVFHFKRFQQTSKNASAYSMSFSALKKLDDYVSFPEILDISPFLAPNRADYRVTMHPDGSLAAPYSTQPPGDKGPALVPVRYRLYAVVVHLGSSTLSGHYIAYVLTEPTAILGTAIVGQDSTSSAPTTDGHLKGDKRDSRVWHYCSDHQVRLASVEEVLQSKAYMCFYERW